MQLLEQNSPQQLNQPKPMKPPKPPRALHAFGRTLRPAARSLKSESEDHSGMHEPAPAPPASTGEDNSSNLDSIIRANARRHVSFLHSSKLRDMHASTQAVALLSLFSFVQEGLQKPCKSPQTIYRGTTQSINAHWCRVLAIVGSILQQACGSTPNSNFRRFWFRRPHSFLLLF